MLQPGTQIGRYEIQRRLGRGGMGTVWVAHDPVLGRLVAIKLFQADLDLPHAESRFINEARAAAALNHANIVTIHDFGNHESQPFIVMEYIQGETLAWMVRSKAETSILEKISWLEQLCDGAAYAHNLGVIHRDIKPANLIIDRTRRLKILDFGIAKLLNAVASNATSMVGTPGYTAPEQILGDPIDRRTDVFSIGVVAYELLSGVEAFPGDSVPAIAHAILSKEPKPLSDVCPGLPPRLVEIVERAIRKEPAERFDTAEALRHALAEARSSLDEAPAVDVFAPTMIRPTPIPNIRPATDARSRPSEHGGGPRTPSRDVSWTDRQHLEHLRAQQLSALVASARAALAEGDLDRAKNDCLQALVLDADDADALAVEGEIEVALTARRAGELVDSARDELGRGSLTGAFELLEQARAIDPYLPDVKVLDRDLRLARAEQDRQRKKTASVQQALEASARALAQGDAEGALALARQALDLQPDSAPAREAEAAALRRLDEETGAAGMADPTIIAPARLPIPPRDTGGIAMTPQTPAGPPPPVSVAVVSAKEERSGGGTAPSARRSRPSIGQAASTVLGRLVTALAPVRARLTALGPQLSAVPARFRALPGRDQKRYAAVGAVVGVIVVVGAIMALIPSGPAPGGSVTLDAIPYAVVTSVENAADGTRLPLPPDASTPLSLALPAGTYRVRLTGPPPASESRLITVVVDRDTATTAEVQRFKSLTPAEYFEPYLASGDVVSANSSEDPVPVASQASAPEAGAEVSQ